MAQEAVAAAYQAQEDVLAGLCASAPSNDVRDCLRMYNPQSNNKQHRTEFSKCQKPTLIATLDYLGIPGHDQYNKPTCINVLICRIQNLFPDDCSICGTKYCISLNDVPLLSCEICGQGSHNLCVLKQLKVPDEQQAAFTPALARASFNPNDLPGIHYLCGACEKVTIPAKETGMLKKKAAVANPGQSVDSWMSLTNGAPSTEKEEEGVPAASSAHKDDNAETAEGETPNGPGVVPAAEIKEDAVEPVHPSGSEKKICPFYRKGTCRYGASGKNCPHDHPRPCKKLIQHGNKAPNGCTLGRDRCENFHPKMCPTSLNKGECFNSECKLRHVNGTKRTKDLNVDNKNPNQTKGNSLVQGNKEGTSSQPEDFLGALRLLKEEMMAEMDKKLEMLKPAQAQPTPQMMNFHSSALQGQPLMWNQTPQTNLGGWNPSMTYQMMPGSTPAQPVIMHMTPTPPRI